MSALTFAGCGGGGGTVSDPPDAAVVDGPLDGTPVIVPPNTSRIGTVQGVYLGSGTSQAQAGFYEEPMGAPGCAWSYGGGCTLTVCNSDAGLVATSAGDIVFTTAGGSVTVVPDGSASYSASGPVPAMAPGTSVMVSGAGGAVPAFTSVPLVMPAPVSVTAPENHATISRAQPLMISWTATQGLAYVNVSQAPMPDAPYPAVYQRTIRCELPADQGGGEVPADFMNQLEPGNIAVSVTGLAVETVAAGDYAVKVRLLALDVTRQLTVE